MSRRSRQPSATLPPPHPDAAERQRARRRTAVFLAAGMLLAAGGTAAFLSLRGSRTPPNLLLITIDTLRADRLGSYGHAGAATPNLDGLAARGVRFPTAVAHAPLTAPSHASILSSLTPLRHGVRDNGRHALPPAVVTVAESLRAAGYATAAFVSGFPLDHRFGFDRGFDTYDDHLPRGDDPRRSAYVERRGDLTTDAALRFVESRATNYHQPWFLWVHYFDPHSPYAAPGAVGARFAASPYDGEVAFTDEQVGRLLQSLHGLGMLDRTVVLATADHGESLGEHGEDTHGVFVYDATLRVPWIMAGPRLPHAEPSVVARGIDVAPTLLELAGVAAPEGWEGRSLLPAAQGKALADAPTYVESLFAQLNLGWAPLHGWRTSRLKLIDAPRPELFQLDTDPAERTDRLRERPHDVTRLRRELQAALAQARTSQAAPADAAAAERLGALGYIGGAPVPAAATGRDPKDGIALINRLERGIAGSRPDPRGAIADLRAVLAEDPRMPLARRYLAVALLAAGDPAGAVREVEALERDGAATAADVVLLSDAQRLAGQAEPALRTAERAARLDPRAPEAVLMQGRALSALGHADNARRAYERVLALSPGHAEALRGLGELDLAGNDVAAAAARYEAILRRDPQDVGALVKLGAARARAGRVDQALPLLQQAVQLAPGDPEALLNLGGALAKSGRPAEAVPFLERAVASGARSTVALNSLGFARLESGDAQGGLAALRASLSVDSRQPRVAEVVSQLSAGQRP